MANGWCSLILGGARSGKSARAEALALSLPGRRHLYVATAEALDGEMTERIARHRAERDRRWDTVEEPLALAEVLERDGTDGTVILVDCLTLWLSNLMHAEQDVEAAGEVLAETLQAIPASVVLVSNEIGLGLVPENALARAFRDAQGRLNQRIAACADHVDFMAAGLPMTLKGAAPPEGAPSQSLGRPGRPGRPRGSVRPAGPSG